MIVIIKGISLLSVPGKVNGTVTEGEISKEHRGFRK